MLALLLLQNLQIFSSDKKTQPCAEIKGKDVVLNGESGLNIW